MLWVPHFSSEFGQGQRCSLGENVFPLHIQKVMEKPTKKRTEIHKEIMVVNLGDREIPMPHYVFEEALR
jgi:hypothetical protein